MEPASAGARPPANGIGSRVLECISSHWHHSHGTASSSPYALLPTSACAPKLAHDEQAELTHSPRSVGASDDTEAREYWQRLETYRETFISAIILLNCCTVGLELDISWDGWFWVNQGLLAAYLTNLCVAAWSEGWAAFLSSYWNWIDITVVCTNLVELGLLVLRSGLHQAPRVIRNLTVVLRLFRLLRILRVFIIIRAFDPLYNLAQTLREALTAVFWFMILIFILLYAFALVFRQLFGLGEINEEGVDREDAVDVMSRNAFRTVPHSFFVLFRVMNADTSELAPILSATDNLLIPFCYMVFMLIASWLAMSALTATIVDKSLSVRDQKKRQTEIAWALTSSEVVSENLRDLFSPIELNQRDELDIEALMSFLRRESNANELSEICKVQAHEAIGVFNAMEIEGVVPVDEYIDKLTHLQSTDTKSSIMRLETQIRQLTQVAANTSLQVWQLQDAIAHNIDQLNRAVVVKPLNIPSSTAAAAPSGPVTAESTEVPSTVADEITSIKSDPFELGTPQAVQKPPIPGAPADLPDWIVKAAGGNKGEDRDCAADHTPASSTQRRQMRPPSVNSRQPVTQEPAVDRETEQAVRDTCDEDTQPVQKIAQLGGRQRRAQVFAPPP